MMPLAVRAEKPIERSTLDPAGQAEAIHQFHAVAEFGLDGTLLTANQKCLDLLGYTLPDLAGRNHSLLVEPGGDKIPSYQLFWARLRKGQVLSGTYPRIGKHGQKLWLQASYNPILDSRGKPFKIVKIATDITEHKRAAEEHLGTIGAFHNIHAIAEFTLGGRFLDANEKFLAPLGYALSELLGQPQSMIVPAEDRLADRQFWAGVAAGRHQSGEFRRTAKDGSLVWFHAAYTPVLDHAGQAVKIMTFATDITRQKHAALDQLQHLLAITTSQSVIEFALDGTILTANETFLTLSGYALSELQGRPHTILAPLDAHAADHDLWARLRRGDVQTAEERRLGKDGRDIWLRGAYHPIRNSAGTPTRIIEVATDITGQKRATADFNGQTAALHRSQMVIEFTLDGTILTANQNFFDRSGFTLEDIQGRPHGILLSHADRENPEFAAFWKKLSSGAHQEGDYRRATKDGREIWIRASYNPILDASGKPARIIAFATDITAERAAAADHLAQIAAIHRTHAVIECKMDGTIISANETYLDLCGYSLSELHGAPLDMVTPQDEQAMQAQRTLWANLNQGHYQAGEYRHIAKGGSEFWLRASYNPYLDAQGRPTKIFVFGTDMTKDRLAAAAAEHDGLTGLPNRMLINDRITQAIILARRRHTRLAVMFLDLDGFKQINDAHGHAVGDKLLQEVATRLTACLRRSDTVSRRGGDEFLVLLPDLRLPEDASVIAGNILTEIAKPFTIDGMDLRVTTSIGIATYPEDAGQTESLIGNADVAMYQAKETARNCYKFFQSSMNARADERRKTESKLRHAIAGHEMSLQFRPKINVANGQVAGVEATPLWTSPELGIVDPSRFLTITQDVALIAEIGNWTLRAACEQAQSWEAAGASPIRLCLTIPSMQYHQNCFAELVAKILAETGFTPGRLELELSKTDLLKSPDLAIKALRKLRDTGVLIAIDDLAGGVAGLGLLCRLPISALKIDETFIRSHATEDNAARIIRAVIAMGHGLGWTVTAEGVETQEELDFLRLHACDEALGPYLGRPTPLAEFATRR
jgi:diguanylate cyclase (GGDEF)-like protein/PAS domain S-box-containing protein